MYRELARKREERGVEEDEGRREREREVKNESRERMRV